MVSVNTHGTPMPDECDEGEADPSKSQILSVELELKAVKYFQDKLFKKGCKLPIKSLAGHLSQAPVDMRNVVGPQTEFKNFLLKHKDIFVLSEDEMVSLTEDIMNKPKSQVALDRSESDSSLDSATSPSKLIIKDVSIKSKPSPITMTASEFKTMKFLKELVETGNGQLALTDVRKKLPSAAEAIKNILNDQDSKIIDFVNKFPNIFVYSDNFISLKKTKLNVIMAGSRPTGPGSGGSDTTSPPSRTEDDMSSSFHSSMTDSLEKPPTTPTQLKNTTPSYRTLNNHKGPVYHLAKLWGIVDLGRHEHVFFDRSILPDGFDDLSKNFKIGEILRFNAVRAARGSRARWRATHVWRDGEDIRSMYGSESTFSLTTFNSSSFDEEIKKLLPNVEANINLPNEQYPYVDASQSNTGCIPVWTVSSHSDASDKGIPSLSMVPETKYMQRSVNKDSKPVIPGYMLVPTSESKKSQVNGSSSYTRDVGCQTISTGDIMATQLYQDDD